MPSARALTQKGSNPREKRMELKMAMMVNACRGDRRREMRGGEERRGEERRGESEKRRVCELQQTDAKTHTHSPHKQKPHRNTATTVSRTYCAFPSVTRSLKTP